MIHNKSYLTDSDIRQGMVTAKSYWYSSSMKYFFQHAL